MISYIKANKELGLLLLVILVVHAIDSGIGFGMLCGLLFSRLGVGK